MTTPLIPGFQGKIEFCSLKGKSLDSCEFVKKETFSQFLKENAKSKRGYSLIQSALCPARTTFGKELAQDLFFPTFIHYALKIDNIALKIFASLLALPFDLITLPIRFVALPFRARRLYQNPEKPHPLAERIGETLSQNASEITLRYAACTTDLIKTEKLEGQTIENWEKKETTGEVRIALKRIPGPKKTQHKGETKVSQFVKCNEIWNEMRSYKTSSEFSRIIS